MVAQVVGTLAFDGQAFASEFGHLSRQVSALQLSELLGTTELVGMVCPGLHSIYSGLTLDTGGRGGPEAVLSYRVERAERRLGLLKLGIQGPTLGGTLTTFFRPPPQEQKAVREVSEKVARDEFASQRALVVGGSRGLGEITAKIVAAGGDDVCLTFCRGEDDARRVAHEIREAGGRCAPVQYDCTGPESDLADALAPGWVPTHLYYFATPFIALERRDFSYQKFQRFCDYYVAGLYRATQAIRRLGDAELIVFYPSTVFLDEPEPGTSEYCAAKAAGEALCQHLERTLQGTRVCSVRLPRMCTDQTASLLPSSREDPLETMLHTVRALA